MTPVERSNNGDDDDGKEVAMIVGKRKGESARAWRAFRIYLGTQPSERTFPGILSRLGRLAWRPEVVARWAERYEWAARANEHARQIEEARRLERLRRLEARADVLREKLLEPFEQAAARFIALLEQGEPRDSQAFIDALVDVSVLIPLAEEALLLTNDAESVEGVLENRRARAANVRAEMMRSIAGQGPEVPGSN